ETLADWIISADNRWFAKAAVNRLWAHLFGRGLVDPVDDFNDANPASHPEILDELAREFAAHKFDLKFMIRVLTSTRAYQLTSAAGTESSPDPKLFARMAVKGLTPEQIFDSLAQAVGYYDLSDRDDPFAIVNNTRRAEFLDTFRNESD